MRCYETFEIEIRGNEPAGSWVDTDVTAVFQCDGQEKTVKGFYAGDEVYKVRFLPEQTGTYEWKVTGDVSASGTEECLPSETSHGMVQAVGNHFQYEDGTKYLPFGTTIYALAHQEDALVETTLQTLKDAPFNKVRHCLFPKSYDYNHNDPEFYPFEKTDGKWDVHRPCMEYWDRMERIIRRLGEMGIESDLILFHSYDRWGFAILSMEDCKTYLEYALSRLSAFPYVWWSLANEYDFLFNRTMEDWYQIESWVVENDPYHHLLSNHNGMKLYDFSREAITHCSVQTNATYKAEEWQTRYQKPVIYDEFCYEGNLHHEWGNITGFEMANRFWSVCAKGAYATHGETFLDENDVLWWAKGGVLKGESPARIGFLKDILYSLPGYLTPWNEPIWGEFFNPTEAYSPYADEGVPPFFRLMNSLGNEDREILQAKTTQCNGCVEDKVFLKYFGDRQPVSAFIYLPEDKTYKVELIDIWEMTRQTILENVSGKCTFTLPGKPGMAVLATEIL